MRTSARRRTVAHSSLPRLGSPRHCLARCSPSGVRDAAEGCFEVLEADADGSVAALVGGDGAISDAAADGLDREGQDFGGFFEAEVDRELLGGHGLDSLECIGMAEARNR